MRRDNTHYIIFPEYFDKKLTRKQGRRIPLNEALENPSLLELKLAAQKLEYDYEIQEYSAYPRQWWEARGRILVEKKTPKLQTIRDMSVEIPRIRAALIKQKKQLIEEAKKRRAAKSTSPRKLDKKQKQTDFKPKRRK
ncbi:MAG: signal recognition particle subunit SRP19/SEC65 family protein [Candidatus Hodarchaeales archaeon]